MYMHYDADEWEVVTERRVCPFHEDNPGGHHPACTCSVSFGQKRRAPGEIAAIKAERARQREDAILAEAEAIKARRALVGLGA